VAITAFLKGHMPAAEFTVVDSVPMRPKQAKSGATVHRYFIQVGSLREADSLVSHRCLLKGTGYTLMDVLTEVEQAEHDRLWPSFITERERGRRAQFCRARLYIEGQEVRLPPPK
jgi:hypothetical protein